MKTYPSYDALAIDLDLHFFDKISILSQIGKRLDDGKWFVVTDDGCCHLFDENGNLDDIKKLYILRENYIRKDVKKIIIPDSVTRIGDWAFNCCTGLMDVAIPHFAKSIGIYAFCNCSSLENVTIGNGITSIEGYAFRCCKNLKSVFFKGKTLRQVRAMKYYPWGIEDKSIIKAELE